MNKETLRMQFLSGVITESEYKEKLKENIYDLTGFHGIKDSGRPKWSEMTADEIEDYLEKDQKKPDRLFGTSLSRAKGYLKQKREEESKKDSLNEHYIAGGIVGVGAINNPFEGRKKESYEDAFEHFLGQKYSLKEIEKYEGDLPKNDLRKLEGELKSAGHDAKLSGIDLNFILVKTPNKGELQVVINDEGQYVVQPRDARTITDKVEFGPTTKSSSGERKDNLDTGIKYVVDYFNKLK